MNIDNEEITILDIKNIITILIIISLIIDIYLNNRAKDNIINGIKYDKTAININQLNCLLVLILAAAYFLINVWNSDEEFNLAIIASFLSIVTAIIYLYISINDENDFTLKDEVPMVNLYF